MKVIFASQNNGKILEVKEILKNLGIKIISLTELHFNEEIEENGDTFEENAFIKAKTIFDKFNLPVMADDSGLMISQLDDRPGIYSARYAGENCTFDDNINKVLEELKDIPTPHQAKFLCCALFYDGHNKLISFGELHGTIIKERRGISGFGYDPIFLPKESNQTLAEMNLDEKNKISHRFRAFSKLRDEMMFLLNSDHNLNNTKS